MNDSDLISFRGGLTVPVAAYSYLVDLQQRGVVLHPAEDGASIDVHPKELLTDDDRQKIKAWRWHIRALLLYEAPERIQ